MDLQQSGRQRRGKCRLKKTNLYFSSNFYYGWNSMPSLREPDLNLDITFFFLVLNKNVLNFNLGFPFSHVISGLIFNCNVIISFPILSKSGCKEISNEKKPSRTLLTFLFYVLTIFESIQLLEQGFFRLHK